MHVLRVSGALQVHARGRRLWRRPAAFILTVILVKRLFGGSLDTGREETKVDEGDGTITRASGVGLMAGGAAAGRHTAVWARIFMNCHMLWRSFGSAPRGLIRPLWGVLCADWCLVSLGSCVRVPCVRRPTTRRFPVRPRAQSESSYFYRFVTCCHLPGSC